MLLVTVFGLSGRLSTHAMVDTGAIETVIPMDFWDEVEPASRPGEEGWLETASGAMIAMRYGIVDLAIRLGTNVHRWSAKVGFTDARAEMVLGDLGFLRHFPVEFDRPAKRMTVRDPVDLPPSFVSQVPTGDLPDDPLEFRRRKAR